MNISYKVNDLKVNKEVTQLARKKFSGEKLDNSDIKII